MAQLVGRRLAFVEHVAQGKGVTDAARAAGYSERHARGRGYTLMQDPAIKEAIEEIRTKAKDRAQFGLEEAVAEVDAMMQQARELKQMTAAANLFTTKVKLFGLISDRLVVETPSIAAALEEGRRRAGLALNRNAPQMIDVTPGAKPVNPFSN